MIYAPWVALLALALPLPFRRAAPVHVAAIGLSMAGVEMRWRMSHALCPLSGARHSAVVQAAVDTVAWLLHPAPGSAAGARRQGAAPPSHKSSFCAVYCASHVAAACLTLHLLYRWEAGKRRAFARQQQAGSSWSSGSGSSSSVAAAQQQLHARVRRSLVTSWRELLPIALCCALWVECLLWRHT